MTIARLATTAIPPSSTPAAISEKPKSRRRDIAEQETGAPPHAQRQPGEDGGEEHAVAGVAAAEVADVDPRQPDDDATGRERAGDAEDQPTDERPAHDVDQPSRITVTDALPVLGGEGRPGRDLVQRVDDQPGDDERGGVERQRQRDRGVVRASRRTTTALACPATAARRWRPPAGPSRTSSRSTSGSPARAVSRGTRLGTVASLAGSQTRLIASMSTVATSTHHSVSTIGMVMKIDAAREVAGDQGPATVKAVGDVAGERPDDDGRQHAEQQHPGDREVLALVAVGRQRARHRRQCEQPQPVAQAGQPEPDPQPPERLDLQHAAGRRMMTRRGLATVIVSAPTTVAAVLLRLGGGLLGGRVLRRGLLGRRSSCRGLLAVRLLRARRLLGPRRSWSSCVDFVALVFFVVGPLARLSLEQLGGSLQGQRLHVVAAPQTSR